MFRSEVSLLWIRKEWYDNTTLAGILEKEDWIQVSFDGFDVDSYKLARNSDCFQQICQNIKTMVAEDINVKLNVVVTNKNYKMLDKIYAKAQELGVDKISFMPLMGSVDPRDEVYFPSDESVFYEMTKVIKMFMSGNNSVIIDSVKLFTVIIQIIHLWRLKKLF